MKISLFTPNSTFDMFQSYPLYRFPLHLYVQIHIIVVRWDWNVLKLLEKSYHCAGVGCSDQIARNLNIILCMEAQMLPLCFPKKNRKDLLEIITAVMFMVLAIVLICDNCAC